MKLSIVLVNRNAGILLKEAINALINACKDVDYEMIIADNAPADKSVEMIENDFPELKIITTDSHQGISALSNQALRACSGQYILIVNADTICGKDSLHKLFTFMDEHQDAGGVGVRMLSPQGRFIPESIHGLTKPWAAFLKFIGFAKHLSKTRLYDRNRKDWVEEFQITEIDILSSDFMMLRRSVLNETGLFDERFEMFGHNIDLSYRIRLAGFKNYYFPKTYIINFESQPLAKFSWDFIKYFYGAMFIFAVKYLFRLPEIKVQGLPQLVPASYEVKA
jgi:GT2 family glycosyltransferase